MTAATAHPFLKSFAFAVILLPIAALGAVTCASQSNLLAACLALGGFIAAPITGAVVWRSARVWPLWQMAALFTLIAIVILAIIYFVYNAAVLMLALG